MHLPYSKLFLHDVHSIAIAADGNIQVLDSSTGAVLHSTTQDPELSGKVQKSGSIVAAAVDESFKYLVTVTSNKSVRVWEIVGLRVVSERETPKKPTDVCITRDAQTVIVSDKFGDVHRYPSLGKTETKEKSSASETTESKKNAKRIADESLLLGHVSLLTALLLSNDEKYIITADRDEHIRVSWYPEAYTIERYCLGHRKFVSALHIPSSDPSLLISGGGDAQLNVWKWMEGKLLHEIPLSEAVIPHVKVVRKKPGRGEGGSDGEGEGDAPRLGSRAKRRAKKQGKRKAEGGRDSISDAERETRGEDSPDVMQVDEQAATEPEPTASADNGESKILGEQQGHAGASPLLAIQKIATLECASNRFVVFSAHGATALFYCKFPDTPESSPQVRSVDLNHPVLDFAQWPNEDEIWITVDGNWPEVPSSTQSEAKFIRTVRIIGDELVLSDDTAHSSLATSLNTSARFEDPQDSLKDIDLYSALVVLPKNLDVEHSAMDDEAQLSEATTKQLSGKELGRLKTKKAVLARQTAQPKSREQSNAPDEDKTLKRKKSESETDIK